MNAIQDTLTKVFPVQKEHTYEGVLTRFFAVGRGKTVCISQIEGQPLYIDVYGCEIKSVEDLRGSKAEKSIQFDRAMPNGDGLYQLASQHLAD